MFSLSISLNIHTSISLSWLRLFVFYVGVWVCAFWMLFVSRSLVRFFSCSALVSSRCNFRMSIRWLYSLLVYFFLILLFFSLIWFFLFHSSCLLTTLFFKCVYSLLRCAAFSFYFIFFFSIWYTKLVFNFSLVLRPRYDFCSKRQQNLFSVIFSRICIFLLLFIIRSTT